MGNVLAPCECGGVSAEATPEGWRCLFCGEIKVKTEPDFHVYGETADPHWRQPEDFDND